MSYPDVSVLFRSATQLAVLSLLYLDQGHEFALPEIVERTGIPQPTVSREIARLDRDGLVCSERREGRRFARAQTTNPIFGELRALLAHHVYG